MRIKRGIPQKFYPENSSTVTARRRKFCPQVFLLCSEMRENYLAGARHTGG